MGLMERVAALLPKVGSSVTQPRPSAGFMRDNTGTVFGMWNPALRRAESDVAMSWERAAARTIDMIQNSGFISGIVDQAVANTVGEGLRLSLRPDAKALGMTEDEALEWAGRVESRFAAWGQRPIDCDAEARCTFGHAQAKGFRHWLGFGEIFSALPYFAYPGSAVQTKLKMLPAYLVPNKSNGDDIVQGVRLNRHGGVQSYFFKQKRKFRFEEEVEIAARDSYGRPQVIHSFDGNIGQVRGISPMVSVLRVARQFDQLSDATLTAALIQAVFAAVMESDMPTQDALKAVLTPSEAGKTSLLDSWFEASAGWNENVDINLGINGRIAHMFPGQKLDFKTSKHPNTQYVDFAKFLLHEMARCAGMTYESATGDYTGATYSSVRMGTTEIFEITRYRRRNVVAPFCQPIFEAWLEEDIEKGHTPFPGGVNGFLENRAAACRAGWRGSGKPQADDLKTAKAFQVLDNMGVVTHGKIAEELGYDDIEEIYATRAREKKLRAKHGLPEPVDQREDPVADALLAEGGTSGRD